MTKKTETKAKVKGADAEQKVLKKIQDGNKAAKSAKDSSAKSADKTKNTKAKPANVKDTKTTTKPLSKENKAGAVTTGKRTFADKDGENKKPKAGGASAAPVLNRRQKQKVSDLIKRLRVSIRLCPPLSQLLLAQPFYSASPFA